MYNGFISREFQRASAAQGIYVHGARTFSTRCGEGHRRRQGWVGRYTGRESKQQKSVCACSGLAVCAPRRDRVGGGGGGGALRVCDAPAERRPGVGSEMTSRAGREGREGG